LYGAFLVKEFRHAGAPPSSVSLFDPKAVSFHRFSAPLRFHTAKNDYEFIVNPIVDVGFGVNGDVTFLPCARFARNFGENFALGLEYYTDLGRLQNFLPLNQQQHNLYGVVDFKIGRFDVNAGIGYGLTSGSDRWMAKMIIGTELNEGFSDKSSETPKLMRRTRPALGSLSPTAATLSEAMLPAGY
jgi:hypothetical protein